MLHHVVWQNLTNVLDVLVASIISLFTEAASTSEASVYFYQTMWCNISEHSHLHTCCHDNFSFSSIKTESVQSGAESFLIACSNSQGITSLSWNLQVHYHVPILRDKKPIHSLKHEIPIIYFNIILTFTSRYSEWSLIFRYLKQNLLNFLAPHVSYMPHPFHIS